MRDLPPSLRRPDGADGARVQALLQEDREASGRVAGLSEQLGVLQGAVDAQLRLTCGALCGGLVSERRATGLAATGADVPQLIAGAVASVATGPAPSAAPSAATARLQDLVTDKSRRFAEELEFLQCLANPAYVGWLLSQGYCDDPAFLAFRNCVLHYFTTSLYIYILYIYIYICNIHI